MKGTKIITLATTLALMASFTGCSDKENKSFRSLASAYSEMTEKTEATGASAERTTASRETAERDPNYIEPASMAQPEESVPESTAASIVNEKFSIGNYGGEQLTWTVLRVEGNRALVLADQVVDTKPYNTDNKDFSWENCSLRKWLNEDFYGQAFSADEQQMIVKTTVHNKDITVDDYDLGNDTEDYIYILSNGEMGSDHYRANVTKVAADNSSYGKVSEYWRRNPGFTRINGLDRLKMGTIFCDGFMTNSGISLDSKDIGVRPAMWVDVDMLVHH